MKHLLFGTVALALAALVVVFLPPLAAFCVVGVALFALARPDLALPALLAIVLAPVVAMAQTVVPVDDVGGWLAIFEQLPAWLTAITALVTAATAITALTPTNADNVVVGAILRVLNILAGNVGGNKNADDL